jgi:hypothetical protein
MSPLANAGNSGASAASIPGRFPASETMADSLSFTERCLAADQEEAKRAGFLPKSDYGDRPKASQRVYGHTEADDEDEAEADEDDDEYKGGDDSEDDVDYVRSRKRSKGTHHERGSRVGAGHERHGAHADAHSRRGENIRRLRMPLVSYTEYTNPILVREVEERGNGDKEMNFEVVEASVQRFLTAAFEGGTMVVRAPKHCYGKKRHEQCGACQEFFVVREFLARHHACTESLRRNMPSLRISFQDLQKVCRKCRRNQCQRRNQCLQRAGQKRGGDDGDDSEEGDE